MGRKYTAAQKTATIKYLAEKTEEIRVRVPKGEKSKYQELAKAKGKSLSKFVLDLLDAEIKKTGSP